MEKNSRVSKAQGSLIGQLAGDALGSLVEFRSPGEIRRLYPGGVRELADGGTWDTVAGQPTDDSEMALLLARMLVRKGAYDPAEARAEYVFWLNSGPFDCGMTISSALRGQPNSESQANGAMMRVCPLGIFGANYGLERVAEWAAKDAELTHPNRVCIETNTLFAMAIAQAVKGNMDGRALYGEIREWALGMNVCRAVLETVERAGEASPGDFVRQQGWVLIAFQNALYQMVHSESLEAALVDTVMRGGDTDTNGAICGALLGAIYGVEGIPAQWKEALMACRPEIGRPGVRHPRPECFWPVDAMELAEQLIGGTLER
jgi:ADP-ribosylglycohydrolase